MPRQPSSRRHSFLRIDHHRSTTKVQLSSFHTIIICLWTFIVLGQSCCVRGNIEDRHEHLVIFLMSFLTCASVMFKHIITCCWVLAIFSSVCVCVDFTLVSLSPSSGLVCSRSQVAQVVCLLLSLSLYLIRLSPNVFTYFHLLFVDLSFWGEPWSPFSLSPALLGISDYPSPSLLVSQPNPNGNKHELGTDRKANKSLQS